MKLEFTNQELNLIYQKALETFEGQHKKYVCIELKGATLDLFGESQDVKYRETYFALLSKNFQTVYKHFCNFAPTKKYSQDVWFNTDEEGFLRRVEILKKCIVLTQ